MHIGVIGAGVVGLTTAHALQRRRHRVTLFEANAEPALEASYANGAQLSYSFTDPLASPALIQALPAILLGRSPGLRVRHRADLHYLSWAARFLWNCLPAAQRRNAQALETLAARSAELMADYHLHAELEYYRGTQGKLVLLPGEPSRTQLESTERKRAEGMDIELLDRPATLELAPALGRWSSRFQTSIYAPYDAVADARQFTQSLAGYLCGQKVVQHYLHKVLRLERSAANVSVVTAQAEYEVDAVVVCSGNDADELLGPHGVPRALLPITGYSLTLPIGNACPDISVTELGERIVFARLGEDVRIAGFADINAKPAEASLRQNQLLAAAQALAPEVAVYGAADAGTWTGHRPSTPGGQPRVGETGTPGIFQNVGHGALGWTLAAATAELVSDAVEQADWSASPSSR